MCRWCALECDLVGAILIETYLLQTMNFHSLIATKATASPV